MNLTDEEVAKLEHRIATERTQTSYYQCETQSCPHYQIPRQIREFVKTRQPCYPPATLCDSSDGCGKPRQKITDTTERE